MPVSHALILGASRGLGLALAGEYLARGWNVTATVRGDARTALHDLAAAGGDALTIERLDITNLDQIEALHDRLAGRRFELLFVNAGISIDPTLTIAETSSEDFTRMMLTNAYAPMRAIEALGDLVTPAGTIGVMSSGLGSVTNNTTGAWEVYRASKAALNTLMRSYAVRNPGNRALIIMAPGWIKTDMGGPDAPLTIEETMPRIVDTLLREAATPGLRYVNNAGATVPW